MRKAEVVESCSTAMAVGRLLFLLSCAICDCCAAQKADFPSLPPASCYKRYSDALKKDPDAVIPFMISTVGHPPNSGGVAAVEASTEVFTDSKVRIRVRINDVNTVSKSCFEEKGMQYHIHDFWKSGSFPEGDTPSNSTNAFLLGSPSEGWAAKTTSCGPKTTGGHWDPTMACGPLSGSPYCKKKDGVVPPSSNGGTTEGLQEDHSYTCTPEEYRRNRFACEVGDFSSKFGYLLLFPEDAILHQDSSTAGVGEETAVDLVAYPGGNGGSGAIRRLQTSSFRVSGSPEDEIPMHSVRRRNPQERREVYIGMVEFVDDSLGHPCLLTGRSMVFHCGNGRRMFCSKFEPVDS